MLVNTCWLSAVLFRKARQIGLPAVILQISACAAALGQSTPDVPIVSERIAQSLTGIYEFSRQNLTFESTIGQEWSDEYMTSLPPENASTQKQNRTFKYSWTDGVFDLELHARTVQDKTILHRQCFVESASSPAQIAMYDDGILKICSDGLPKREISSYQSNSITLPFAFLTKTKDPHDIFSWAVHDLFTPSVIADFLKDSSFSTSKSEDPNYLTATAARESSGYTDIAKFSLGNSKVRFEGFTRNFPNGKPAVEIKVNNSIAIAAKSSNGLEIEIPQSYEVSYFTEDGKLLHKDNHSWRLTQNQPPVAGVKMEKISRVFLSGENKWFNIGDFK